MVELILTNKDGKTLDLLNNQTKFILSGVEALHGIDTNLATEENPFIDGGFNLTPRIFPHFRTTKVLRAASLRRSIFLPLFFTLVLLNVPRTFLGFLCLYSLVLTSRLAIIYISVLTDIVRIPCRTAVNRHL